MMSEIPSFIYEALCKGAIECYKSTACEPEDDAAFVCVEAILGNTYTAVGFVLSYRIENSVEGSEARYFVCDNLRANYEEIFKAYNNIYGMIKRREAWAA